ncbi:phenylacetate--CoA ligase family protein [Janthinobacterium sp. GW458P]|uniref:phenylacetate--CoA ligase family protein n=1 Tax=Janthinobacterium sp. GW458P TaxID=1981504 RepID=UPI00111FF462|nr:phenylacetate--CoA ligase family protein [Janthinobacterium sp. GW458P]MBE3028130.1 phenylacetate--CoA ligase family protein [Janthinobacterium sp. GW458P]
MTMSSIKNELRFGMRAMLRDNFLLQRAMGRLAAHERMSVDELAHYSRLRLHASMQHAMRTLPHYAAMPGGFTPAQAAQVLHEHFPVIDKATLLAHRAALYPHQGRKRPWQAAGQTSGTTGTPLTIFRSMQSVLMENAFIQRHWSWSGYTPRLTRATLRGDMVTGINQTRPPFWFWNRYNRQLLLSSRHLTEAHADAIIDRLEQAAPAMLQAYPSTAYTLAGFLQRRGRRLSIPYVFTASEPLYPHQRALIAERLGATIMDMYGMAERVAFATECEHGHMHVNSDYSHVEILDEHGKATDGEGFVVGTTFHNLAMPLLRYRLSDRSRWKPGSCACGRPFPMIEPVTGKFEDSITGSGGAVISPSVLTFAFKGVDNILKSQVAQVGAARWEVRLLPGPAFSDSDKLKLLDNIHTMVDSGVSVEVVLKAALPNTAAGKFRWVVNETNTQANR